MIIVDCGSPPSGITVMVAMPSAVSFGIIALTWPGDAKNCGDCRVWPALSVTSMVTPARVVGSGVSFAISVSVVKPWPNTATISLAANIGPIKLAAFVGATPAGTTRSCTK